MKITIGGLHDIAPKIIGFQESLTKGNFKNIKKFQSSEAHLCISCMVFRDLLPFYDLKFFEQKIKNNKQS
jgi:hypothetical protein